MPSGVSPAAPAIAAGTAEQQKILAELLNGRGKENERTIQSSIHHLLKTAGAFARIAHEVPIGDGRRIDVEADSLIIEVKRDLRGGTRLGSAAQQVCGYVEARNRQRGKAHIGVVTDGVEWRAYADRGGRYQQIKSHTVRGTGSAQAEQLVTWLRQLAATRMQVATDRSSSAHDGKVAEKILSVLILVGFGITFMAAGSWWAVLGALLLFIAFTVVMSAVT